MNTGLATFRNRKTGWFWAEVSATLAATLGGISKTEDWPSLAEAAAYGASPGGPKSGDIVTLYRGGLTQTRAYDSDVEKWVDFAGFVGGSLVVTGGITADHLAVGSITADRIKSDVFNVKLLWESESARFVGSAITYTQINFFTGITSAGYDTLLIRVHTLEGATKSYDSVVCPAVSVDGIIWNVPAQGFSIRFLFSIRFKSY